MYLNKVLIIFIFCLNYKQLYSSSIKTKPLEDFEETKSGISETSDLEPEFTTVSDNTEENQEHILNETHEETAPEPNLAADEVDRSQSTCHKTCENYHLNKLGHDCVMVEYKISEKAKSASDCTQLCQKYSICSSAIYLAPRKVTTNDLHLLFEKVIDWDNWVPYKQPDNQINHHQKDSKDLASDRIQQQLEDKISNNLVPDGVDPDQHPGVILQPEDQKGMFDFAIVNISATTNQELYGFCYIYEERIPDDNRLRCKSSLHNFHSIEIECIEDIDCADQKQRKKCDRGKCGKLCQDYNTIHIPNTCMGKYYFGHSFVGDLESCLEFCLSNKECKSVDFGNFGSCLINYVNRNDTQLIIGCDSKNNEIWDYYEILDDSECLHEKPHPSPTEDFCLNNPGICKNGGNCKPVELPHPHQDFSYDCHCPCNWCGKHCDQLNMKTFRNGCLNNSVLVWSVTDSSSDCIDMCLDEIHCKSVSYSGTSGTCALHWADQNTGQVLASPDCPNYRTDLLEREWTLFNIICDSTTCDSTVQVIEIKELRGCAGYPCLNGGQCADIFKNGKIAGYHCLCKCGFCGDRCESHNFVMTANACIWKSHIPNEPNTSDWYLEFVPLNTCLDACALKFPLCRSVDFSKKGHCYLNSNDSASAVVTEGCNNYQRQSWTLYDLSCVCNNKAVFH